MKTLEVLRFELEYQAKRPWTWLYFAALLGLSFIIATQGATEGPKAEGYLYNSYYGMGMLTLIAGFMGLLVAAAISGEAGARDPETRMDPLLYTSPVAERSYVSGRFGAACVLIAIALLLVQAGFMVGAFFVDLPPELVAPISVGTHLTVYALLALPNAILATALFFSLSLVTRRSVAGYLAAAVLFFTSLFIWLLVAMKFGRWDVAKILDPLAMSTIQELGRVTTSVQKNAWVPWSDSSLLINRALWLGIAAATIAVVRARFQFKTAGSSRRWQRTSEDVQPIDRSIPITVPKIEAAPSALKVRLQQFLSIAGQSFREVAISWGALVLVIISLILTLLGPKAMSHFDIPVVPTTEQMIGWIGHPGELIWFIVPVLSAYYAGELVWRERDTRLSEIADAAPVPEWVQFIGKFTGLALLLVAYQVMLIMGCILIQLQMGFTDIEYDLYLKAVLGLSLTQHLLFAALAFALHVIINQKYVAYLAIIAVYAFMQQAPALGIENHLLVFSSSPDWTYSDMSRFGASLVPWMWFKAYWAGWVILLCVIATLLWIRGKEQGFRERMAILRERLSLRSGAIAAAMIAVIIGTSGFVLYNTNVLNNPVSESKWLEERALYEKAYGKFAGITQPALSGMSIRAELYPGERKTLLHAKYFLVNDSDSSISAIHLSSENEVETSNVAFDRPGKVVTDDPKLHYRIYELAAPLAPGDSMHVSFDVRFHEKGFSNAGIDPSVTKNGTFIDGLDWLPDIGYQRWKELNSRVDRMEYGLGPRPEIPSLDDPAARNRGNAKRIGFEAIIGTDEDQVGVAPGELRRTWTENGRRYFHYVADAPMRNDFAIFSANYAKRTAQWNGVTLEVLYHPSHDTNVDRMLASMRASLEYFTRHLGPYPYRVLRLVEHPGQSMTLHASPINIWFQEAFAGLNSAADERKFDFVFAVVAHEVAHQWWGNQLSGADVEGAPLLSESLAWYSAMNIVAATHGEDHLQRLLDMFHGSEWMIQRGAPPLLRMYDKWAAYRKGPFAMMALRQYMGEDRVNTALKRLFDNYKTGEPPLPLSTDLYAELEAVTPDSLKPLLGDLFERNTYWEIFTKSVSSRPAGNGRFEVTLEVSARKLLVDKQGVEKEVPMNDLVEAGVYGAGGPTTRGIELHCRLHRIRTGIQRITITVDRPPILAGIDPRYLLIDDEPGNNMKAVK